MVYRRVYSMLTTAWHIFDSALKFHLVKIIEINTGMIKANLSIVRQSLQQIEKSYAQKKMLLHFGTH